MKFHFRPLNCAGLCCHVCYPVCTQAISVSINGELVGEKITNKTVFVFIKKLKKTKSAMKLISNIFEPTLSNGVMISVLILGL